MTIDELLTQTAMEMGFTDERLLKDASDHAKTCAGAGEMVEGKLNRDLTAEEIVYYRKYAVVLIKLCKTVPGFSEEFIKLGTPIPGKN